MLDKVYSSLSDEEKAIYDRFIEFFSVCPICENRNDVGLGERVFLLEHQGNHSGDVRTGHAASRVKDMFSVGSHVGAVSPELGVFGQGLAPGADLARV